MKWLALKTRLSFSFLFLVLGNKTASNGPPLERKEVERGGREKTSSEGWKYSLKNKKVESEWAKSQLLKGQMAAKGIKEITKER